MAAIALVMWAVLSPPWLGLRLAPQDGAVRIISVDASSPARALFAGGNLLAVAGLPLIADDVAEEPDMFETYAQVERFMARQATLAASLAAPRVTLVATSPGGAPQTISIMPARRPLSSLSSAFWVQLITGAGALLIGGCVLAVRPGEATTRLFAVSGAMVSLSAFAAAIYSSRELAIDGGLFRLLSALNHVGALGFGVAMVALFALYPTRMVPARLLWILPAVFIPWVATDTLHAAVSPALGQAVPTLILMLGIIVGVIFQAIVNRRDPRAKAALNWLGLSVIVGAGAFVSLIVAPILIEAPPIMAQGHAFGFFLLIYAGLALGVSRYRLFDLSEWAFRVMFYTGGVLLLVAVDIALIAFLGVQQAISFGIAAPLVGFAYLPLRGVLWDRIIGRRQLKEPELFQSVLDVSLAATPSERAGRWRDLLQKMFDPLAMEPTDETVEDVDIREEGMQVALPAAADSPAMLLRYPWGGRRLFSSAHRSLARELVRLMRYTEETRNAYERGGKEERQRIARDLHDDLGARLLSGLYKTDIGDAHRVMREAITEVRTIVSTLSTDQPRLDHVLAALRHESGERLRAAGLEMDWPTGPLDERPTPLDYRVYRCLTSVHREAVSNVIRHAKARRVVIATSEVDGDLRTTIVDDGVGIPDAAAQGDADGNGLRGLMHRVQELKGEMGVRRLAKGTSVEIRLPLRPAPAVAPNFGPEPGAQPA